MPCRNRRFRAGRGTEGSTRRYVASILLAWGLAVNVAAQPSKADVEELQQYQAAMPLLATARAHIDAGDYARAEALLADVVASVPEMSEAHLLLAKSRYAQGRFPAALTAMEKAEKSFGATAGLMETVRAARKAELEKEKREHLGVVASLEAKQAAPGAVADAATLARIGSAKQAAELIDQEIVEIDRANVPEMPAEYPFFHGNVLLRLGRTAEAIEHYLAALAIDPSYPPAGNNLASVYFDAKRYQEARATIERLEAHGGSVNPELKKRVLAALP